MIIVYHKGVKSAQLSFFYEEWNFSSIVKLDIEGCSVLADQGP